MNRNLFCSRKGGAKIGRKFFPIRTSDLLAKQLERQAIKMEARQAKREAKA